MFTLKRGLVVLVGVLAVIVPASCSYEVGVEQQGRITHERSDSDEVSLTYENGEAYFEFSNGMVANTEEEYLAILDELASLGIAISEVNLLATEESDNEGSSGEGDGYGWHRDPLWVPGTSYDVRIIPPHSNHYVGGCIRRNNVPHINFMIQDVFNGRLLWDLHLAVWSESGHPCVGIYITPNGWCWRYCSPWSYADIR